MIDAARIIQDYAAGGTSHRKLAQKYGTSVGTIGRILRGQAIEKPAPKLLAFPTPKARDEKPADWDNWQDALATLRAKRWITVTHDCDNHFGDHDQSALDMRYRLYAHKQPDLYVVGSDAADFDSISRFETEPDREVEDVLDDFAAYWFPHIDNLNSISPRAFKVFILGNHCLRIYDLMNNDGRRVRRTIHDKWLQIVRYGGVLWIGKEQEVEIGPLLVKHGDLASEHTAKALLEREAYQVHVMAGHVHRSTSYTREGRRYPVTAVTSGCTQSLRPHYVKAKGLQTPRRWNHGVAFGTIDMNSMWGDFDNVRFANIDGRMIANCDGKILEQAA